MISHPEQPQLMTTYANDQVISYQLRSIITSVEEGSAIIDNVMGKLYRHFFKQMRRQNALVQPLSQNALRELYAQVGEELERLAQLIPQLLTLANQLPTDFHRRLNYFVKSDYQLFQSLEAHLNQLTNLLEPLQAFIASHETLIQGSSQVSRLTMRHIDDIFSIKLHWQNFVIAPTLKTLLSPYQSVVLTSATLQVDRSLISLPHNWAIPHLMRTISSSCAARSITNNRHNSSWHLIHHKSVVTIMRPNSPMPSISWRTMKPKPWSCSIH
ncbi:hypothetical protein [Lacticaseibacillus saniviri]|uniref:hypothetical protein n=1 Tax=Lacticaseibacillus saniviri TaxID=931533 RepID=UPI000ADB0A59|nr:hypothetical protein [Lacticaseibacillus saniviri]